jgi:hypothetical protein
MFPQQQQQQQQQQPFPPYPHHLLPHGQHPQPIPVPNPMMAHPPVQQLVTLLPPQPPTILPLHPPRPPQPPNPALSYPDPIKALNLPHDAAKSVSYNTSIPAINNEINPTPTNDTQTPNTAPLRSSAQQPTPTTQLTQITQITQNRHQRDLVSLNQHLQAMGNYQGSTAGQLLQGNPNRNGLNNNTPSNYYQPLRQQKQQIGYQEEHGRSSRDREYQSINNQNNDIPGTAQPIQLMQGQQTLQQPQIAQQNLNAIFQNNHPRTQPHMFISTQNPLLQPQQPPHPPQLQQPQQPTSAQSGPDDGSLRQQGIDQPYLSPKPSTTSDGGLIGLIGEITAQNAQNIASQHINPSKITHPQTVAPNPNNNILGSPGTASVNLPPTKGTITGKNITTETRAHVPAFYNRPLTPASVPAFPYNPRGKTNKKIEKKVDKNTEEDAQFKKALTELFLTFPKLFLKTSVILYHPRHLINQKFCHGTIMPEERQLYLNEWAITPSSGAPFQNLRLDDFGSFRLVQRNIRALAPHILPPETVDRILVGKSQFCFLCDTFSGTEHGEFHHEYFQHNSVTFKCHSCLISLKTEGQLRIHISTRIQCAYYLLAKEAQEAGGFDKLDPELLAFYDPDNIKQYNINPLTEELSLAPPTPTLQPPIEIEVVEDEIEEPVIQNTPIVVVPDAVGPVPGSGLTLEQNSRLFKEQYTYLSAQYSTLFEPTDAHLDGLLIAPTSFDQYHCITPLEREFFFAIWNFLSPSPRLNHLDFANITLREFQSLIMSTRTVPVHTLVGTLLSMTSADRIDLSTSTKGPCLKSPHFQVYCFLCDSVHSSIGAEAHFNYFTRSRSKVAPFRCHPCLSAFKTRSSLISHTASTRCRYFTLAKLARESGGWEYIDTVLRDFFDPVKIVQHSTQFRLIPKDELMKVEETVWDQIGENDKNEIENEKNNCDKNEQDLTQAISPQDPSPANSAQFVKDINPPGNDVINAHTSFPTTTQAPQFHPTTSPTTISNSQNLPQILQVYDDPPNSLFEVAETSFPAGDDPTTTNPLAFLPTTFNSSLYVFNTNMNHFVPSQIGFQAPITIPPRLHGATYAVIQAYIDETLRRLKQTPTYNDVVWFVSKSTRRVIATQTTFQVDTGFAFGHFKIVYEIDKNAPRKFRNALQLAETFPIVLRYLTGLLDSSQGQVE